MSGWDADQVSIVIPRVDKQQEVTYFTSSAANWCKDSDPVEVMRRQKESDKLRRERRQPQRYMSNGFWLWKLPIAYEVGFDINEFKPQVDGAEMLFRYDYPVPDES